MELQTKVMTVLAFIIAAVFTFSVTPYVLLISWWYPTGPLAVCLRLINLSCSVFCYADLYSACSICF